MSIRAHPLRLLLHLAVVAVACAFIPTRAFAEDSVATTLAGGYTRLLFTLRPAAHGAAAVNGNVLTIAFDRPIALDPAKLQVSMPTVISSARIDPDKKTLRIVVAQTIKLHTSVSGSEYAVDLL